MKGQKLNTDFPSAINALESALGRYVPKRLYKRIFRGKGLEFERYRKYEPGDDASIIDWKASLRTNETLVRQYIEERDLKILFIIDVGENMVFGSAPKLKCEYAAEVSAALMHLILDYNDNAGIMFFSDQVRKYMAPDKGQKHFHLLTDFLSNPEFYGGLPNFEALLDHLINHVENIDSIFLLSDFLYLDNSLKSKLAIVSEKFETIGVMVRDPIDISLPQHKKEVWVEDLRTGDQFVVNPARVKKEYEKYAGQQMEQVESMFKKSRADFFKLKTNQGFASDLAAFLRKRVEEGKQVVPRG